jgi:hypothetical protein
MFADQVSSPHTCHARRVVKHLILANTSALRHCAMAFGRRHACCYNRVNTA